MAKQHLLIVDSDPKSLRVLEVSLKKAGFSITRASNGLDAIEKIQISVPDMIITETAMPEMNGFELIQQLRASSEWQDIPVMFLTAQKSIEDKIRGLEQGVEDYLTKPIFIREILARVSLVMQRRQRERLENRGSKTEFSGSLSDMGIIDLIQTIDISQKSGVIHVEREGDSGDIFFRNGKVIDASTFSRRGEDAVYRMLVWSEGHFQIEFKHVANKDTISLSTQGLLMEGMRRLDEWGRLQEQLPSLNSIFDIDDHLLSERLGEIPDEINSLLKHFDGKCSLLEVVNLCPLGDLEALTIITKLYFEGLIVDIGTAHQDELETAPPQHPASVNAPEHELSVPASSSYDDMPERVSMPPNNPVRDVASSGGVPAASDDAQLPVSEGGNDNTQQMPGIKTSLPPDQQTMVMHVSKTPTSPPPAVGVQQSLEDGEMPASAMNPGDIDSGESLVPSDPMSGAPAGEAFGGGNSAAGGATIVGMARPADLDDFNNEAADIDTTAPSTVISENEHGLDNDKGVEQQPPVEYTETKKRGIPEVQAASEDGETVESMSDDDEPGDLTGEDGVHSTESAADEAKNDSLEAAADEASNDDDDDTDKAEATSDDDIDTAEDSGRGVEGNKGDMDAGDEGDGDADDDENDEDDEELEDEWAELDSAASRGYLKKVIIAALAAVLLGGAATIVFGTDWVQMPAKKEDVVVAKQKSAKKTGKAEQSDGDGASVKAGAKQHKLTPAVDSAKAVAEETGSAEQKNGEAGDGDSAVAENDSDIVPTMSPSLEEVPPPDAATLAEYKKLLKKSGKQSRAKQLKTLEAAIAIHPNGVEALTEYAIGAMERRKYQDKALEYATRVTQLDPGNARAWLAIGYIHQLRSDIDESKAAYKKCAECKGPAEYVRNCRLLAR